MPRKSLIALLFPALAFAQQRGLHQGIGSPPPAQLGATDPYIAFHLPALNDTAGSPVETILTGLQVGARAQRLHLTSQSPIDAWTAAQSLLSPDAAPENRVTFAPVPAIIFNGSTASALNQLLARPGALSVQVASATVTVDQPIEIQHSGVTLDLGSAQLVSANALPYLLRIDNTSNVSVTGGNFTQGNSGVLVNSSSAVTVADTRIVNLTGDGIVVTGSDHVTVQGNRISGVGLAGIVIHRGTTASVVENNQVTDDLGTQNASGAILLTDREVDLTANPAAILGAGGYGLVPQPMSQRMNPPHDNLIAFNLMARNSSSGVYVDGAVRTVIFSNTIQSNAKEGLCLDDGATANVVASNIVADNGDRWGESNVVLADEFISGGGRLADGTPADKVPGISLDNALYNIVFANTVAHNFGGGVKIVRTGYFNLIGMNTIMDDNDGASAQAHFFGVELGSAAGNGPSVELDFTPSHGNLVFSNLIRGTHWSGIFLGGGSDQNQMFNNVILDAQNWALESVAQMQNTSLNNLTTLPSRNIGSGLDAALVTSGQPQNDMPPPAATP